MLIDTGSVYRRGVGGRVQDNFYFMRDVCGNLNFINSSLIFYELFEFGFSFYSISYIN